MCSVTTRTPDSSVLMRCSALKPAAGGSGPVAPGARATGAPIAVPVPVTVAVSVAAGPVAAVARGAAREAVARATLAAARAAGADAGELLDALALDVRVVCQSQADPSPLAVDLHHAHVDLVALVEHVLDAVDALARGHVGDVQQAVGALGEFDEGAERRRLDDLADVFVADLDLLHHHPYPLDERVRELAVGGVDQHLAVVVDVDLGVELL